jgi:6-phosphogluconolactonase
VPPPRLEVAGDAEAAAAQAAALIAGTARAAIAERGSFTIALSGGHSPWRMCELLGNEDVDWERWELFQVDERIARAGDPERNLTHLMTSLPAAAGPRLHQMPVGEDDLDRAAADYEAELPERLDLIHLGLGPDGHTASLVPDDAVLDVTDRRVALTADSYQGRARMTLTYPALAAARRVMWLVTGEDKREALRRLLAQDRSIPAGRVEARDAVVICDVDPAG